MKYMVDNSKGGFPLLRNAHMYSYLQVNRGKVMDMLTNFNLMERFGILAKARLVIWEWLEEI